MRSGRVAAGSACRGRRGELETRPGGPAACTREEERTAQQDDVADGVRKTPPRRR